MLANRLIRQLRAGETTYGLWVTLESPAVTEIAALLGMDWICIDMEHGHLGFREVLEHLRAARGYELTTLVRVPAVREDLVKRALDIGAHGVLLPQVQGTADMELAFRFGRYPPRGRRGVGGERAVHWGLGFRDYIAAANEETLIVPIIETREAVEEIDSILATPGLEAIFFGPADLSASSGYPGEWEGPGVAERIMEVRERAAKRGIAAGVMARSVEDGERRREEGFRMIGLGSDAGLLVEALRGRLEALRGPVTPRVE
jgi:2-keto-3-deoxy-L-rhamnonate aldolase RhmA